MSEANKQVIRAFLDDVINQGRFDRANDLVKEDFVELDPLPGAAVAQLVEKTLGVPAALRERAVSAFGR